MLARRAIKLFAGFRVSSTLTGTRLIATVSSCPSCSTSLASSASTSRFEALCPSCSSILPPPSSELSHFKLFDVPAAYAIEKRKLKPTFLKMQNEVHPDRFSGKGSSQEQWARVWSTRVNEAYKTLESDLSRGEYMLQENGVEIGEAESVADPELLMQVMETRERIEEAMTEDEIAQIRDENKADMRATVDELAKAFEAKELDRAKDLVVKLRYLTNADNVCRDWSPKA